MTTRFMKIISFRNDVFICKTFISAKFTNFSLTSVPFPNSELRLENCNHNLFEIFNSQRTTLQDHSAKAGPT